jgi:hypothetical protein
VAAAVDAAAEPAILPRNRFRDLTALALLAGCLFLIAALATFDPADPPVSYGFPPHARATNACGFLGAAAASGLYEWFGLGAWLAVAAVAGCDLMLLRRRAMPDLPLRTAGAIVAVVGACTLLAMFLPDWVSRPIWGPGGHAGGIGRHFSEGYFAKTGAAIIVTTISGAGLFLACDTHRDRLRGRRVSPWCQDRLAVPCRKQRHCRSRHGVPRAAASHSWRR